MPLLDPDRWTGKIFTGSWTDTGRTDTSTEPATGETLGTFGTATADDLASSAAAAREAQSSWAATGQKQRAEVLRRAADILEQNGDEVLEWIMREAGKARSAAELELQLSIDEIREAVPLPSQPYGALLPTGQPDRVSVARRQPRGVVAVIAPWNFPLNLAMRSVAPALATGNGVVLKPASETVICCGVVIARVFEEAGLPAGLLHMLPGKGSELGNAFADDPNIHMISFTGSTPVGLQLAQAAAAHVKKFVAELGGNNAYLVLDDADVDRAASTGAWGSFVHQGQVCMATGRHLVAEALVDAYVDALVQRADALSVGNPLDGTDLGPIINDSQADHIEDIVRRSVDAGAELRAGGTRDGLFYRPTVLAGVTPEMPAYAEEIFGPVAVVTAVADDDEAVRLANDTPYGLVAAVHAGDPARARKVGDRLRAGMVHVNDTTVDDEVIAPFGGRDESGGGGTFGSFTNLDQFTEWQWLTIREEQSLSGG